MAFKDTYRLEKVYYENIWTLLNLLKNVDKNNVDMGTVKELLDNAIADNESIIIIYKNLGELYAELQNQHMELGKELEKLKDSLEEFKDEINDKIDENHNYLMGLIKDLEQRVDALEHAVDSLEERMDQAETDIDNLETRMDTAEGDIDNLEQNKQDKLTAGSGIAIDPDTNEITNTAQGKIYTAGSGIAIDPDTNEISNTAQIPELSTNIPTFKSETIVFGLSRPTERQTINFNLSNDIEKLLNSKEARVQITRSPVAPSLTDGSYLLLYDIHVAATINNNYYEIDEKSFYDYFYNGNNLAHNFRSNKIVNINEFVRKLKRYNETTPIESLSLEIVYALTYSLNGNAANISGLPYAIKENYVNLLIAE